LPRRVWSLPNQHGLLDTETITKVIEAGYIAVSHSPETLDYIHRMEVPPDSRFSQFARKKVVFLVKVLKRAREAGVPLDDYFAAITPENCRLDISNGGVVGQLLLEGEVGFSRIWEKSVRTQIYAVPTMEKVISVRSPISTSDNALLAHYEIRNSVAFYPHFNRLKVMESSSDLRLVRGPEKLSLTNLKFLLTTPWDILAITRSLWFHEFTIHPVLELLTYHFVTPVRLVGATTAMSGRRLILYARDYLNYEYRFFIGQDEFKEMFPRVVHPERLTDGLESSFWLLYGIAYYNSEASVLRGQPISQDEFRAFSFLAYLRLRKKIDSRVLRRYDERSLEAVKGDFLEHDGHVYYIPGFASRNEVLMQVSQTSDIMSLISKGIVRDIAEVPRVAMKWQRYYRSVPPARSAYCGDQIEEPKPLVDIELKRAAKEEALPSAADLFTVYMPGESDVLNPGYWIPVVEGGIFRERAKLVAFRVWENAEAALPRFYDELNRRLRRRKLVAVVRGKFREFGELTVILQIEPLKPWGNPRIVPD